MYSRHTLNVHCKSCRPYTLAKKKVFWYSKVLINKHDVPIWFCVVNEDARKKSLLLSIIYFSRGINLADKHELLPYHLQDIVLGIRDTRRHRI